MNTTLIVRIAMLVAVAGFFLPWGLVSCSGMPIASVSGVDLALGQLSVTSPSTGQVERQSIGLNIFVVLAVLGTLAGLGLSFRAKNGMELRRAGIAAAVAAVVTFAGFMWFKDFPRREAAAAKSSQGSNYPELDAAALASIRIDEQMGYWITLLALAGAAGVGVFGQSLIAGGGTSGARSDRGGTEPGP